MEGKQKNKVAVVVIASAVIALAAAASIKKKRYRSTQPYVHRDAIPHPLWSKHTTHWKELATYGSSSDFVKHLNFDQNVFFDVLLLCLSVQGLKSTMEARVAMDPKRRAATQFWIQWPYLDLC